MLQQVRQARFQRLQVFLVQVGNRNAAVILQRAHRGNNNHGIGLQAAQAALDVQELLSAQVSAKSSFRYRVIAQSQRHARCHNGIAAVRNIREGAAMHECGRSFKRLHQVRLDSVF